MASSKGKGKGGSNLRAFRSKVARLQKKGLVSKTIDPSTLKPSKYMRAKVKALAPVLEGRLTAVPRSPKVAKEYKEAGFEVVNNRVLLDAQTARKVSRTPQTESEYLTVRKFVGEDGLTVVEKVIMPATVGNFDDFLEGLRAGRFDKLKRPQDLWAFQFYGNNSAATFSNAALLHDYLERYKAIAEGQEGAWEHFVLYRVYPPGAWDPQGGPGQVKRRQRQGRTLQDRRQDKRRSKAVHSMADLRALDAKRKREARERENPAQREKRLAGNRASMRLAREETYRDRGRPARRYTKRKP